MAFQYDLMKDPIDLARNKTVSILDLRQKSGSSLILNINSDVTLKLSKSENTYWKFRIV